MWVTQQVVQNKLRMKRNHEEGEIANSVSDNPELRYEIWKFEQTRRSGDEQAMNNYIPTMR